MAIRRIGQILVDMGFITDEQLEMLLEEQSQNPGQLLGKIAEDMGLITDDQIAQGLAEQMNIQFVDLEGVEIPKNILAEVSDAMAQLYRVLPLRLSDDVLTIATCDPQNLAMQDELRRIQRTLGITFILVTHDQEEALIMSDRIAVMFDGKMMGERMPENTDEKELGLLMAGMNGEMA